MSSALAAAECLRGATGDEPEKDILFFAGPDDFSGVPNGLGSLDLALADSVDAM